MTISDTTIYSDSFYDRQRAGSFASAQSVLPIVFAILPPKSVVDFGCGVGTWLAVAQKLGAEVCVGIEGSWVKDQKLYISEQSLLEKDLELPVSLQDRFDLAMSLEVAEHLSPGRADTFVSDLCAASDLVLFSAATPGQDGDRHLNEQWPSYWAERFVRQGYIPLDIIRPIIRDNDDVAVWYRTNAILYARAELGLKILSGLKQPQLSNLDLPCELEAVGLRRASSQFLHYAKNLAFWTKVRISQRLGRPQ
jgi:cyclopropane fatty-acyl-phospholipid synthase-like methyltransferase